MKIVVNVAVSSGILAHVARHLSDMVRVCVYPDATLHYFRSYLTKQTHIRMRIVPHCVRINTNVFIRACNRIGGACNKPNQGK